MWGLLAIAFLFAQSSGDRIQGAVGRLTAVHDHTITVRNDRGARTFLITAETKIWRGDYVDLGQLRVGDDLGIRFRVPEGAGEAVAVDIDANIDRWNGTITKVSGNVVEIELKDEDGNLLGMKGTVTFWDKTTFLVDGASRSDLKVGAYLEVIGLVENDRMRAWRVIGFDPASGVRRAK
jgi:hypothetical protein